MMRQAIVQHACAKCLLVMQPIVLQKPPYIHISLRILPPLTTAPSQITLHGMSAYISFPAWISPEVIPGLPVRWYALMYIVAFFITYVLFRWQARHGEIDINADDSMSLFLWTIGGLLIGARLFSVLLYDGTSYYWTHPWMIFWPFRNGQFVGLPGMSYHGGVVGAVVGAIIFSKIHHKNFFSMADGLVAGIPLGYTFGRLGNFINGELWGRVTTQGWGIVFPDAPSFSTNYEWVRNVAQHIGMEYVPGMALNLPRHPSQLYEALFEGILLWAFMWFVLRPMRPRKFPGFLLSWYLIGYGAVRFFLEYFREPDGHIGFVVALGNGADTPALFQSMLNISMGQILCLLMVLAGVILYVVQDQRTRKARLAQAQQKRTQHPRGAKAPARKKR